MFDINFYRKTYELINSTVLVGKQELYERLESFRNPKPVIYNIETTNRCNQRCKMCPRTTKMTRKIEDLDKSLFFDIVKQIKPHSKEDWRDWEKFVQNTYGISKFEQSENNFFLYVIPQVIQLHAYGEPLLDKNMPEYVKILTENGFKSYFSCNPVNINIHELEKMFDNGLSYIKFSIESVNDKEHKNIRGKTLNFQQTFDKIKKLLDIKKKFGYNISIVVTMLNLNKENQMEEYKNLINAFKSMDVYLYLKSEDQLWYRGNYHKTNSIHWSEPCKHPWMSMTVKSNGEVAMCMEDYNNEIVLGDTNKNSLYDIWNGEKYRKFRKQHVFLNNDKIKCVCECDMRLVGKNG